ncbi:helix-turn-helix transcriptional regulator [Aneurinibacillus aneurinilyticus]|nr:helix-turn-helix transcriptional regulator [Aneurinibacillus aneurinilyticus]MED0706060.1 helix-turn-helix transcriptional regulator [Aneurinibacillus aneurinilyticus]MED0726399.1 helix-turn-helix transcriptional regulator [Aneurinibacillus aneurinilyticus]MED0735190.1 helix-turn-helix transcriptional regulator [Aneurinibacillus aneurinilyticus]MED0743547.1 helix-turn-helix transcriptional regulator [Aneurinibacillus aneurinilyticus]
MKERERIMKIRIRLKEILAEKGISQRELARKMGIRHPTINHLCSDNVDRVYIRTLEQICEALGITIDQLIVSVEEPNSPKE